MEEQKAWKKIEDTKKKAKEIMSVKQRNIQQQQFKEQIALEKDEQYRQQMEKNQMQREQLKGGVQYSKELHQKKLLEEAERVKNEKKEQSEMMAMQRYQEQMKNASMKQIVKQQEQEVKERKMQDQAEKKLRQRQELMNKIIQENEQRLLIEQEVARMEQEELELIQKLQNTQMLQKSAYQDLEGALNGEISPEKLKQLESESPSKGMRAQTSSKNKAPISQERSQSNLNQSSSGNINSLPFIKNPVHTKPSQKTNLAKDILNLTEISPERYQVYDSPTSLKKNMVQPRSLSQIKTRPSEDQLLMANAMNDRMIQLTGVSRIVSTSNNPSKMANTMVKRRIHDDGITMLGQHQTLNESLQQEMEEKLKLYEDRMNMQMQQKAKNFYEKQQRKDNILKTKEDLLQKNAKNKEDIQQIRQIILEQREKFKVDDHSSKKTKKLEMLQQRNDQLSRKLNVLENHNQSLRQNYSSRLLDKHLTSEQINDKIKQLSTYESALIDRLKNTHQKQQVAYKDLESIVHQGYDYYLSSFKEKREKHQQLFSNGSYLNSRNDAIGSQYNTLQPSNQQNLTLEQPSQGQL